MSRYYELGHAEGPCYDYIPTKLLKFEFQATYLPITTGNLDLCIEAIRRNAPPNGRDTLFRVIFLRGDSIDEKNICRWKYCSYTRDLQVRDLFYSFSSENKNFHE